MSEDEKTVDPLFLQLVLSFQAGAWQHLGKVASPISGKVERDLRMAQHTIDLLGMLEAKTAGNLNPEEKSLLEHVLYELRLNYVDERNKGETETEPSSSAEESEKSGEETDSAGGNADSKKNPEGS